MCTSHKSDTPNHCRWAAPKSTETWGPGWLGKRFIPAESSAGRTAGCQSGMGMVTTMPCPDMPQGQTWFWLSLCPCSSPDPAPPLPPHPETEESLETALVAGQGKRGGGQGTRVWGNSEQEPTLQKQWDRGKKGHACMKPSPKTLVLSHRTSLTKHKSKDKIIRSFKMVTTEH